MKEVSLRWGMAWLKSNTFPPLRENCSMRLCDSNQVAETWASRAKAQEAFCVCFWMGGRINVRIRRVRHLTMSNRGLKNHYFESWILAVSKGPSHDSFITKGLSTSLRGPKCFPLQFGFKVSHLQGKWGSQVPWTQRLCGLLQPVWQPMQWNGAHRERYTTASMGT